MCVTEGMFSTATLYPKATMCRLHVEMNDLTTNDTFQKSINVAQGDYYVSSKEDICLTTLLGSCVATCIWDKRQRIGGINHYLLPGSGNSDQGFLRYGVNAMELLINGLLKVGCHKLDLQAKVFGGAQMLNTISQIGAENGKFACDYLNAEGIDVVGGSLGGKRGRKIRFFPTTGRVQHRFMEINDNAFAVEANVTAMPKKSGGDLELF